MPESEPQWLKPHWLEVFFGTTESLALPGPWRNFNHLEGAGESGFLVASLLGMTT